jgi:hypothetical protein
VIGALIICSINTPAAGCETPTPTPKPAPIIIYKPPVYNPPTYNPPVYNGPMNNGGAGGAGGAGGSATVGVDVDVNQNTEYEDRRELPSPAPLPGVVQPSFAQDPRDDTDFRVFSVREVLADLPGPIEYEELKRLSNTSAKVADSLLRSRYKQTKAIIFDAPPAGARFLGWAPVYSENNKITSFNLLGNAGMFACEHGATHAVLVKEGYRRAGTFTGWHIGLGTSAMGISGDAGSSAFGGGASIGPGYTSAESVRVDRPFAVFKLYLFPDTD